jgi:hypothetical protein
VFKGGDGGDTYDGGQGRDQFVDTQTGLNHFHMNYNANSPALHGATYTDIHQETSPTCSMLSSLSAEALTGDGPSLLGRIHTVDSTHFKVDIWVGGTTGHYEHPVVTFDGNYTDFDPKPDEEGEFWVIVYQRAILQQFNNDQSLYADPQKALDAMSRYWVTTVQNPGYNQSPCPSNDQFRFDFVDLKALRNAGWAVVAGTYDRASLRTSLGLVENHSYTIVSISGSGPASGTVVLRNPWGIDCQDANGNTTTRDGNGNDGIVTLSWNQFLSAFEQATFEYSQQNATC